MRSLAPAGALLFLCLAAASGCADSDPDPVAGTAAPPGTGLVSDLPAAAVQGRLLQVGGPSGAGPDPVPGRVTFTAADGAVASTRVDESGAFSIQLSPGVYQIRGRSPRHRAGECQTAKPTTTLTEAETVTVDVLCQRK